MMTEEQLERYFSPEGFRHFRAYLESLPRFAVAGMPWLTYGCPLFKWLEFEGLPISTINLDRCHLADEAVVTPPWMCVFQYLAMQASQEVGGVYRPLTVDRARDILEDTANLLAHIGWREEARDGEVCWQGEDPSDTY